LQGICLLILDVDWIVFELMKIERTTSKGRAIRSSHD
jgi:hypothetical protein